MTLQYLPTEKILVNPDTGKRLSVIVADDGEVYASIYGVVALLAVARFWGARFIGHYQPICFTLTKGVGRPTACVKVANVSRIEAFVADQQARSVGGIYAIPMGGSNAV